MRRAPADDVTDDALLLLFVLLLLPPLEDAISVPVCVGVVGSERAAALPWKRPGSRGVSSLGLGVCSVGARSGLPLVGLVISRRAAACSSVENPGKWTFH